MPAEKQRRLTKGVRYAASPLFVPPQATYPSHTTVNGALIGTGMLESLHSPVMATHGHDTQDSQNTGGSQDFNPDKTVIMASSPSVSGTETFEGFDDFDRIEVSTPPGKYILI